MKIILASKSPRRRELLDLINIKYEVFVSEVDETLEPKLEIEQQAKLLAYKKAKTVYEQTSGDRIIIGSDTMVIKDKKIYGKPKDEKEAFEMLKELRNSKHQVITSLAILVEKDGKYDEEITYDIADVYINDITDEEIREWIRTGESLDKAGGYALQGEFTKHIEKINGNYNTVIGLPIHKVYDIFKKYKIKTGEVEIKYEKSCGCIIINEDKVLLIQHNAGHWDFPKGHMEKNETEIETARREVKEETNIDVLIQENKRYVSEYYPKEDTFKQVIFFLATCKTQDIKIQEEEIKNIEWLSFENALERITHNNSKEVLKQVIKDIEMQLEQNKNYEYIGKILNVEIDRPFGSKHPKHGFIYPVNYGYIPNTISGDGEELDCYVLGIFEPLEKFTGKCIAIIHRTNDNDDKLIIVPEEKQYTNEQIRALTEFQEQYFESEIIK